MAAVLARSPSWVEVSTIHGFWRAWSGVQGSDASWCEVANLTPPAMNSTPAASRCVARVRCQGALNDGENDPVRHQEPAIPAELAKIAAICMAREVVIGGRTVIGIDDARDPRAGLGARRAHSKRAHSKRGHSNWIKGRIAEYGFTEGMDHRILLARTGEQTRSGGHDAQFQVRPRFAGMPGIRGHPRRRERPFRRRR